MAIPDIHRIALCRIGYIVTVRWGLTEDLSEVVGPATLHEAQRSGQIKHFIFPYLGQLDKALPDPPSDLVRREEAHSYPTDFNAMPTEWIDRLSIRGEQLTLCLARAYIPHLIDKPAIC